MIKNLEELKAKTKTAINKKAEYLLNNMQTIEMLPENEKEEGT